jgi:3-dehydroquinate dehydratase/shikimate dehydrogenase
MQGVSVTVPHKEKAAAAAAEPDAAVRTSGACNTLLRAGKKFRGLNTDAAGFAAPLAPFRESGRLAPDFGATVVGAGGAARAVIYALKQLCGARILVLNRTPEKARALADHFGCAWARLDESALPLIAQYADVIAQTTSAGMAPQEGVDPMAFYQFTGREIAYDLIYKPEFTAFLSRARQAGCVTLNGAAMLFSQARVQFKEFTGRDYPLTREEYEARIKALLAPPAAAC